MVCRLRRDVTNILSAETGMALLLVLFVVSLLIIIAAEFAFTTRMEINNARNFKEDIEGYFFAQAGFQYALTEVIGKYDEIFLGPDGQVGFYRKWFHENPDFGFTEPQENADGEIVVAWPPLPIRNGIPIDRGFFDYIITDEEGRLNINYLDSRLRIGEKTMRDIFRDLLIATGVPEGDEPDIVIDSILDWIDKGDEHRLNGAETDWYEQNYAEKGFAYPYSCKNEKLDTIDELLLIRGISPALLYGSNSVFALDGSDDEPVYKGLLPYVTVYGYHRKVNLASAPPLLVQIIDPDGAEEALQERMDGQKKETRNLSRTFRIEVRGYSDAADVEHVITAVVRRSERRDSGGGAEIYYWNAGSPVFARDLQSYQEGLLDTDGLAGD
ncbi:general secretion pathway protein GspK [bacterium]|nr:general secretion pathway protein GspK [candidate division CSSED10-310 bacterium]